MDDSLKATMAQMKKLETGAEKLDKEMKQTMKGGAVSVDYLNHKLKTFQRLSDMAFDPADQARYNRELANTRRQIDQIRMQGVSNPSVTQPPIGKKGMFSGMRGGNMGDFASQMPGMGMIGMGNPYVMAGAAVAGGGKFAWDSYKESLNIDREMAKINATAKLTKPALESLEGQLMGMANNAQVAFETVPAGFEAILSSNGDLNQSLAITRNSLKAAKANGADFAEVGKGVSQTLSIVAKDGYDAARVLDIFQAGKDFGAGEFADFARYIPQVTALADNLGVKFEEVTASYAFMTKKFTTEQSATLLQNTYQALGKTDRQKALKKQLGVDVFNNKGQFRGMVDIFGDINKSLDGLTDEQRIRKLDKIGFDMQAATGISALSSGYKELALGIDAANNSAGALNQTLAVTATDADKLTVLNNNWKQLKNSIGEAAAPGISSAIKALNDAAFGSDTQTRMQGINDLLGQYARNWTTTFKYSNPYGLMYMGASSLADSLFGGGDSAAPRDFVDDVRRTAMFAKSVVDKDMAANPMKLKAAIGLDDSELKNYIRFAESNPIQVKAMLGLNDAGYKKYMDAAKGTLQDTAVKDFKTDARKGSSSTTAAADEVGKVVAGGRQVRNVTVNIQQVKTDINNYNNAPAEEKTIDSLAIITEGIVRAVRDAEHVLDV